MEHILITGAAGFIGFHLAHRLLREGYRVIGADAFTSYYDVALKRARWSQLLSFPHFKAYEADVATPGFLSSVFPKERPHYVFHLAAQAGVRHGLTDPRSYLSPNLSGTFEILEAVREHPVAHLLLASTSSVYGGNMPPFSEKDRTDHPLSFYAATKKAGEDMAHAYAHLWQQPTTVVRFFTVYGPWGRPDMALFRFTKAMLAQEPIEIYNHGHMIRDFTYIEDVVEALIRLMPVYPKNRQDETERVSTNLSPTAPFRSVNIACGRRILLLTYLEALEKALGIRAKKHFMAMQKGDVPETCGNVDLLRQLTGFTPNVSVDAGIKAFVEWYHDFYVKGDKYS